jgi:hypothetical protein
MRYIVIAPLFLQDAFSLSRVANERDLQTYIMCREEVRRQPLMAIMVPGIIVSMQVRNHIIS